MRRSGVVGGLFVVVITILAVVTGARAAGKDSTRPQARGGQDGWTIPPTAAEEKNPLAISDTALAAGRRLFGDKCARCHGLRGKGDGPDGDEAHQDDMDLTAASRASRNPDGVIFYKIWNGRPPSKMDPMSKELTRDQVWSLVAYVQTLRAKASGRP